MMTRAPVNIRAYVSVSIMFSFLLGQFLGAALLGQRRLLFLCLTLSARSPLILCTRGCIRKWLIAHLDYCRTQCRSPLQPHPTASAGTFPGIGSLLLSRPLLLWAAPCPLHLGEPHRTILSWLSSLRQPSRISGLLLHLFLNCSFRGFSASG